jgi:hypothetical protein
MKLDDAARGAADRRGKVFFLDVHMKRVDQQPDIGRRDVVNEPQALIDGVDEVGLEAVG